MVAHIAAALRRKQDERESLLLEATFEEIQECSGAARRLGRPRKVLQGRRHADIALFDQRGRTVHVIEAKRRWERRTCYRDIKRLLALLNGCAGERDGSLRHGFLALPIVEWAETRREVRAKVHARACNIEEDVQTSFGIEESTVEYCLGGMRWYPNQFGEEGEWAMEGFLRDFLDLIRKLDIAPKNSATG